MNCVNANQFINVKPMYTFDSSKFNELYSERITKESSKAILKKVK